MDIVAFLVAFVVTFVVSQMVFNTSNTRER